MILPRVTFVLLLLLPLFCVAREEQNDFEQKVYILVNQERAKAGLPAYFRNPNLERAARDHSEDMLKQNYFDHNGLDGSTPFSRISSAGYDWSQAGENIANGQTTPESVMTSWMNSAGHRANILSNGFVEIGVGISSSGFYWTQTFGTKMSKACGNSLKESGESCDDGNTKSGDGCSSSCSIESGFSCVETAPFQPASICTATGTTTGGSTSGGTAPTSAPTTRAPTTTAPTTRAPTTTAPTTRAPTTSGGSTSTTGGSTSTTGGSGTPTGTGVSQFEKQVFTLVNQQRAAAGLAPYTWSNQLFNAARAHSQDMMKQNYFSHTGLDGRSPFDRITSAGYKWNNAGENIAGGQRTPEQVMNSWMNSAGHKANILGNYKDIGVGLSTSGFLWTQCFGTRSSAQGAAAPPGDDVMAADSNDPSSGGSDGGGGLSGGAIAGIVIGVLVGVAILVVVIMYVVKKNGSGGGRVTLA